MDQDFLRFGLAAFVTLLVVVDPPGVVPIYVALTSDEEPRRRRAILIRAVLIAFGVALFFLVAGRAVLSYLGVSVHAFSISGGILLFVAAMPMLFGQRGGLQAPEGKERGARAVAGRERRALGMAGDERNARAIVEKAGSAKSTVSNDISVFPLAMPLLSGPGTIATILLLTSQAGGDPGLRASRYPGITRSPRSFYPERVSEHAACIQPFQGRNLCGVGTDVGFLTRRVTPG